MPLYTPDDISERRRLEDILRGCGRQRDWLAYKGSVNLQMVRGITGDAVSAGISVRDISRMTGLSTQTLHTWMRDHMRPVPMAHLGRSGLPPHGLEEAVLRTIAEQPKRDWTPVEARGAIPAEWPSGSVEDVAVALETLVRTHLIWGDERSGFRLAPPDEDDAAS